MSSKKLWFPQSNGFKLPHVPNILNKILNYPETHPILALLSLLAISMLLYSGGVKHRKTLSFPRAYQYSNTVAPGYCAGLNTTVTRSKSMTSCRRLVVAFSLGRMCSVRLKMATITASCCFLLDLLEY